MAQLWLICQFKKIQFDIFWIAFYYYLKYKVDKLVSCLHFFDCTQPFAVNFLFILETIFLYIEPNWVRVKVLRDRRGTAPRPPEVLRCFFSFGLRVWLCFLFLPFFPHIFLTFTLCVCSLTYEIKTSVKKKWSSLILNPSPITLMFTSNSSYSAIKN